MTLCGSCGEQITRPDWDQHAWVHHLFGNLYCRTNSGQMAVPHTVGSDRKATS